LANAKKKKEIVTLESLKGCPCMICADIDKCFDTGGKDPVNCNDITGWINPRKAE
jgi:hypothetical protein